MLTSSQILTEGSTSYTMMVSSQNQAEIFWKDTGMGNSTIPVTSHPLNAWTNATQGGIGDLFPSTWIEFWRHLYVQMADGTIRGYDIQFQAENTTVTPIEAFSVTNNEGPVKGLGGTRLISSSSFDTSGVEVLKVYYQIGGDDITIFTRPMKGGEWTSEALPIPLE